MFRSGANLVEARSHSDSVSGIYAHEFHSRRSVNSFSVGAQEFQMHVSIFRFYYGEDDTEKKGDDCSVRAFGGANREWGERGGGDGGGQTEDEGQINFSISIV